MIYFCFIPFLFTPHPPFLDKLGIKFYVSTRDPGSVIRLQANYTCAFHKSRKSRAGVMFLSFVDLSGLGPLASSLQMRRSTRWAMGPYYFLKNQNTAPGVGIEPTTNRLTGDRSTAELLPNLFYSKNYSGPYRNLGHYMTSIPFDGSTSSP